MIQIVLQYMQVIIILFLLFLSKCKLGQIFGGENRLIKSSHRF